MENRSGGREPGRWAVADGSSFPAPGATPEGQTFRGESLTLRFINFVKLPHTLFALPFALLGLLAASFLRPVSWRTAGLVVIAFSAARWVAMGFNRIADRRFDGQNPRTMNRELPR
ncbi:MAG: UbiA family prenyltransferase, partial [Gemmatimonadales bacterium]